MATGSADFGLDLHDVRHVLSPSGWGTWKPKGYAAIRKPRNHRKIQEEAGLKARVFKGANDKRVVSSFLTRF